MKGFLRRLRGIVGTGLTWALGWAGATTVFSVILGAPLGRLVGVATTGAIFGFIAGGTFAVILSIAERHHSLADLSVRRVALWGGIGGVALVLGFAPQFLGSGMSPQQMVNAYFIPLVLNGLLGAGFASGSVALARRSETKLIDGDEDPVLSLEGEDQPLLTLGGE